MHFILLFSLLLVQSVVLSAGDKEIALPKPRMNETVSLEEAFNRSRTVRVYSEKPLALAEISAVLWAAAGKRYDSVTAASRTYPSARGRYPTTFYLVAGAIEGLQPGVYSYDQSAHSLKLLKKGDCREELVKDYPYAAFVGQAPATIVLGTAFQDWFPERDRSLYLPLDAGLATQNIRLEALALALAVGIAGEFDPARVKEFLGIEETPILFLTLGHSVQE